MSIAQAVTEDTGQTGLRPPHPADVHAARLAAGQACLEAALWFLEQGITPCCCCDPEHVGVGKDHACESPGKRPVHDWKALQTCLPTPEQVRRQWTRYPIGNVGLVLGQHSGLVRIDVDGQAGATLLQQWSGGDLPPTWVFTSGSGGQGWLYGWPHDLPCRTTSITGTGPHEELRLMAEGSQTVVPPSRHPSGGTYTWLPGQSPQEVPLAPAPAWLLARLEKPAQPEEEVPPRREGEPADYQRVASALARIPNEADAGYDVWLQLGMALHSTGQPWARAVWDGWSVQSPKYDAVKQAKAWASFAADGKVTLGSLFHLAKAHRNGTRSVPDMTQATPATDDDEPWPELEPAQQDPSPPLSDYTNALAFVQDHHQDVRYIEAWDKWLHWAGTHWRYDVQAPIMQRAKQTIRRLLRDAASVPEEALPVWMRHIKASFSKGSLSAMIALAQDEQGIPVAIADLNTHPWLLPCTNGTVDLTTGGLRASCRDDLLTECLPLAYDKDADCPHWKTFLLDIMGRVTCSDDADPLQGAELATHQEANDRAIRLCAYLQRVLGQGLTGDVSEQDLYIFYGTGANGKSTLLNTILASLGTYAMKGTAELLMTTRNDRHPTERADLFGKRLVCTIETQEAGRLNETFIKEATGGDPIRARRMREDFWEFLPTHTMILATNHKPQIRGTDHAIWRRIKLIPFTVTIPDAKQDKGLPAKLLQELPGILAWMVQGCLDWQKNGLHPPKEVTTATDAYKQEQDVFDNFLVTECLRTPTACVSAADIYEAYTIWCKDNDIEPIGKRAFGIRLAESGCTPDQGTGGRREWKGVGLPAKRQEDARYEKRGA